MSMTDLLDLIIGGEIDVATDYCEQHDLLLDYLYFDKYNAILCYCRSCSDSTSGFSEESGRSYANPSAVSHEKLSYVGKRMSLKSASGRGRNFKSSTNEAFRS